MLNPKYNFRYIVGDSGTCYVNNDYFADVIYRFSLRDAIEKKFVKTIDYVAEDVSHSKDEKFQKIYDNHIQNKTVKYRLIKPFDMKFNNRNISVHGIKPEDVVNELEFYRYWNSIKEMFTNTVLVAHNAEFDIGVLKAVLNTYRLSYPNLNYTCSLRIARRTWIGLKSYSLGNIGNYFGYSFSHHHALEDAEMSANLILKACEETKSESIKELNAKLNISCGSLFADKTHIKVKSNPRKKQSL